MDEVLTGLPPVVAPDCRVLVLGSILGGFATLDTDAGGVRVMLIGHEKGNDTQSRIKHNFGMGKPEGYRKAIRLMEMASRFGLPVVTLVDTSGAFPGIEAEERGQAEAIARATEACLALPVPMVAAIVGEGGSGGAVALASANRVLMMEHAVYSVISPEGCASILWRTNERAADAAEARDRLFDRGGHRPCIQKVNRQQRCLGTFNLPGAGCERVPITREQGHVRTAPVKVLNDRFGQLTGGAGDQDAVLGSHRWPRHGRRAW